VKNARQLAKLTQIQLSQKTGMGVTQISDIERGRYKAPDIATLRKLAEGLGVPLLSLTPFGDADERHADRNIAIREMVKQWPFIRAFEDEIARKTAISDDKRQTLLDRLETCIARAVSLVIAADALAEALGKTHGINPNDLVRHGAAVQKDSPEAGGSADGAAQTRIRELEGRVAAYESLIAQIRRKAHEFLAIAARSDKGGQTPRHKRRRSSGR